MSIVIFTGMCWTLQIVHYTINIGVGKNRSVYVFIKGKTLNMCVLAEHCHTNQLPKSSVCRVLLVFIQGSLFFIELKCYLVKYNIKAAKIARDYND